MSQPTHDVFISYSSTNQTVADAVCAGLEAAGLVCWISSRDIQPSEAFPKAIMRGLKGSRTFLVIFSSASNASEDVAREVHQAADRKMPMIPFRIEDVRADEELGYYLGKTHWLNAVEPPLEGHIKKLVGVVEALIAKPKLASNSQPDLQARPPAGPGKPAAETVVVSNRGRAGRASTASRRRWIVGGGLAVVMAAILIGVLGANGGKGHPNGAPPGRTESPKGAAPDVLRMALVPGASVESLAYSKRFVAHLGRTLDVPAEYVHIERYQESLERFVTGEVHLVWLGALTGCQARAKVPGAQAIAQGDEDLRRRSVFIANRNAGLSATSSFPSSLAGKSFVFGSSASTSGRLMPEYFIRKYTGKAPNDLFGRVGFARSQSGVLRSVAGGTFEAGAISKRVLDAADSPEVVRVWTSPAYSDFHFTAHPALGRAFGTDFIAKLQRAIVSYEDKDVLERVFGRRSGFVSAANADFEATRSVAETLDFLR